jgi:hypothetical protein
MKQAGVSRTRFVLLAAMMFVLVSAARGATLYAANNGVDSPACGASATPCRSITQTIANAAAGDTIQVRAGRYSADLNVNGTYGEPGEEVPAFGAMLAIYKPLIILSTDGAAATIIDATRVIVDTGVLIVTGDAEFGRPDHGFTVTNPAGRFGIALQGTNLKVRGNQVVETRSPSSGFGIDAEDLPYVILIEGNQVIGWNFGIFIHTAGETASKNQVSVCRTICIFADGGNVVGNVVTGVGSSEGIALDSAASAIGNAVYGHSLGISVGSSFTGVVQKNNVFGNRDCGLHNSGAVGVTATHNYWGAATGPGADPADDVCNQNGGTTTTIPFATARFAINPSFEP